MVDKKLQESIAQFCGVTRASQKDAKKFLEKYKRLDVAINAYYNDPTAASSTTSTTELNNLFDKYKDGDEIKADGTIRFCQDLSVNPMDVVLLAVAFELKSPGIARWTRAGWVDGWKSMGCFSQDQMRNSLTPLRKKLGNDPDYFRKVYNYTFDIAREEGQRSLGIETAREFWKLLLPHGLNGGALAHIKQDGEDVSMDGREGWKREYETWWLDFLNEKGLKGVSKDTWNMFLDFVRTIDSDFGNYNPEEAWPSTIDDFVEWARARLRAVA